MEKLLRYWVGSILGVLLLITAAAQGVAFPDVAAGSWYGAAVEEMTQKGLLTGCDDGTFQPMREISAAEFVVITLRCTGRELALGEGHWASAALSYARDEGWFDWDELPFDGSCWTACDEPISRQLAVKILMKALLPNTKYDFNVESQKISDFSSLNGRYYEAVLSAYAAGIAKGDEAGAFHPERGLTRAEACVLFRRALDRRENLPPSQADPGPKTPSQNMETVSGGVSENGWLQVKGTQLCNEAGEPVALHGMSSHGLQWYGHFVNSQTIQNTAAYGANVFRIAMYTGEGGYLSQPNVIKEKAFEAIDAAVQNDMYAILDWHILSDGNPMNHVTEAEIFFAEAAERYAEMPNIIYEICNEPNGNVTWAGDVKPYAQRLVSVIRARSPKSIILIGSPTWSQDIHLAAADPIEGENLMYTLHFYAGTHGQDLRNRIDSVRAAGLPVFVSEWGTSRADGSGGVFLEESRVWLDYLEERGISWCNWSLCDKDETSAALKPGTAPDRDWTEKDLTTSGQFVFSRFNSSKDEIK